MRNTKQEITIPFSGFYYSMHDDLIENEFNMMFSDHATGCEVNTELRDNAHMQTNYGPVFEKYAEKYAELFAYETGLNLRFKLLSRPREYNFTTDRIFCHIDQKTIKKLIRETSRENLTQCAKNDYTSRDGFISFYDPDFTTWGHASEWDYNHLKTLLDAWLLTNSDKIVDCLSSEDSAARYIEFKVFESIACNGYIGNWLYDVIPSRFLKLHDYLESRKNRKAA
jgi:hypothetical protein